MRDAPQRGARLAEPLHPLLPARCGHLTLSHGPLCPCRVPGPRVHRWQSLRLVPAAVTGPPTVPGCRHRLAQPHPAPAGCGPSRRLAGLRGRASPVCSGPRLCTPTRGVGTPAPGSPEPWGFPRLHTPTRGMGTPAPGPPEPQGSPAHRSASPHVRSASTRGRSLPSC